MSSLGECCFMDLPTMLHFDDDFLTVPQHGDMSSSSSLDVTDLFLPEMSFGEGSVEATSAFSSPSSEASSRLDDLPDFTLELPLGDLHQRQEAAMPAPLPLGPTGLRLQLDFGSVMTAWRGMGSALHPFQMRGDALAAATAAIPSTADLEASLSAAAQSGTGAPAAPATPGAAIGAAAAAAAAAEEVRRAKEAAAREVARARDAARRAAARKSGERRVAYPARKLSADKRPRIKGRFVTRAEYEQMLAADRAVPCT